MEIHPYEMRLDWAIKQNAGLSKNGILIVKNSARACSDPVWPSWPGWVNQSVYMEKNGSARRVTYHRKRLTRPSSLFSHVNGSPRFVRKCMKSWLAQGGLGRVVTLLFVTNFLHTGAALVLRVVLQVACVAGIPKGKGRELWRETTREGGGTHAPHAISRA